MSSPKLPHGHYWDFREVYPKSLTVFLMKHAVPKPEIVAQWSIARSSAMKEWDRAKLARKAQEALLSTLKPFSSVMSGLYGEGYVEGYADCKDGKKASFTRPRARSRKAAGT